MEKSKTKITGIANTEKYSQVQLYPEKVGELCSPAEVNIMENLENEKEFLTPSNLSKFVHCSHIFTQYRDGLKKKKICLNSQISNQNKINCFSILLSNNLLFSSSSFSKLKKK